MSVFCLIVFLVSSSLWFFTSEYSTLFGVYWPTCAMTRRDIKRLMLLLLLPALWLGGKGDVETSVCQHLGMLSVDCCTMMVILMSSFVVLLALRFFSVKASVSYALLGALGACWLISGNGRGPDWDFVLSFLAAPLMAFILSALIRLLIRTVLSKVRAHMIKVSYYMRLIVISCIAMTLVAIGLNWGGLLCGIGDMVQNELTVQVLAVVIVGAIAFLYMSAGLSASDESSGVFAEFSIYAVVSVGFSVAVTMLLFSFETTASLLHLCPVPLSVSALVTASIAGAETAQWSRLIPNREYVKEFIAMTACPLGSFVLAYLLINVMGPASDDAMVAFIVMSAAVLALMVMAFAGYARRQRRNTEATDRILYAQRQQIYEHSRALSDMKLKVVLSENQALQNAVEMKRQEVMNVALSIVEQREFLETLGAMVKELSKEEDPKMKDKLIADLESAVRQRLSYDRDVDSQYFYAQAESLHEDFNAKLSENFPNLTQQERRLATLLRLGFSSKYIATLMNITPKSVEISRYRLRQKLGLEKGDNLVNFIKSI